MHNICERGIDNLESLFDVDAHPEHVDDPLKPMRELERSRAKFEIKKGKRSNALIELTSKIQEAQARSAQELGLLSLGQLAKQVGATRQAVRSALRRR